ncbi:MAG: MmcQ/YjbR family DNA-binding protein [Alphaproteobacteria bacterium]|nr:MmcQ/YjbR family DNA-binding protein [Alphaproteobacteria bacterium]MBL7096669.1 MmcQ/YjbR family DNA-binding protein [Alphaproteobacteria bacterium]
MKARAKAVAGAYSARVVALEAFLTGKLGASEVKASVNASMYKVADKVFAILSKKTGYVVLKSPPESVPMLKEVYAGVGHKTHLDRRRWIAVELDADVPMKEVQRLATVSYDLVRASAEKPAKRKAKKVVTRAR